MILYLLPFIVVLNLTPGTLGHSYFGTGNVTGACPAVCQGQSVPYGVMMECYVQAQEDCSFEGYMVPEDPLIPTCKTESATEVSYFLIDIMEIRALEALEMLSDGTWGESRMEVEFTDPIKEACEMRFGTVILAAETTCGIDLETVKATALLDTLTVGSTSWSFKFSDVYNGTSIISFVQSPTVEAQSNKSRSTRCN